MVGEVSLAGYRPKPSPSPHSFAIHHSSDRQRSSTPALNSAVPGPFPDRFQDSSRTVPRQFPGVLRPFQDRSATLSGPYALHRPFLRPSPTISGPFQGRSHSIFPTVSETVSRPFPDHSRTTPGSFRPFAARTPTVYNADAIPPYPTERLLYRARVAVAAPYLPTRLTERAASNCERRTPAGRPLSAAGKPLPAATERAAEAWAERGAAVAAALVSVFRGRDEVQDETVRNDHTSPPANRSNG